MSKKLWLPPQKILGPASPLRPMPKVRIAGLDVHSALGQQIVQLYAGKIGQFHMEQAHNYSLSPTAIHRGRRDLGDIRLRYTNLHGQEIIDIEIAPEVVEQLRSKVEIPPDYVVIDLLVQGDPDVQGEFLAQCMNPPLVETAPQGVDYEIDDGFANDDYSTRVERPIFQYAEPWSQTSTVVQPNRVASLKVDFRSMPKFTHVTIDLYGGALPDEYPIIAQEFSHWDQDTVSTETEVAELIYDFYGHAVASGLNPHFDPTSVATPPSGNPASSFPDLWADEMVALFDTPNEVHTASGITTYSCVVQVDVTELSSVTGLIDPVHPAFTTTKLNLRAVATKHEQFTTVTGIFDPVYGPYEAVGVLKHRFYWPGTVLRHALTTHKYPAAIWAERDGVYPERQQFATVERITDDDSVLLGRLEIERFPPSIRFVPAT